MQAHRGSDYAYVKAVGWLLLLSNVALISQQYFYDQYSVPNSITNDFGYAASVAGFYGAYTIAHWIFGFKYFKVGNVLKFVTNDQPVPAERTQLFERVNYLAIAISALAAAVAGILIYLLHAVDKTNLLFGVVYWSYALTKVFIGLLQLITAILLG